ncbi:DUF4118 domain-containing protein [Streptomyces cirratus]
MSGYRHRDAAALFAALAAPFLVALALVPFRTDLSATNAALILVVAVVAVAAVGTRTAGAVAALSAAVWFDFFLTSPTNGSRSRNPMTSRRRSCCSSSA